MYDSLLKIKKILYSIGGIILSCFIKRDEKMIAFGSWCGKFYIDNSKYLFEEAISSLDESYTLIWIGNNNLRKKIPIKKNVILLEKDTWRSMMFLLKCKYMYCSQFHFEDLCTYNVFNGAKITYLHHGFPIKKWGMDSLGNKKRKTTIEKIYNKVLSIEYEYSNFAVSSQTQCDNYVTSLSNMGFKEEKALKFGTPRNDMYVKYDVDYSIKLKKQYSKYLEFDFEKKIVLYLPTFRRSGVETESLYQRKNFVESENIKSVLKDNNAILIEKNHFAENNNNANIVLCKRDDNYLHLTKDVNIQEIMMFTDVLISDYSGAFVDFLLLDRPIIHYVYDYDFYKNTDSGLYYEISDFASGAVAYEYQSFVKFLDEILNGKDLYSEIREQRRTQFLLFEKGNASREILNNTLLK